MNEDFTPHVIGNPTVSGTALLAVRSLLLTGREPTPHGDDGGVDKTRRNDIHRATMDDGPRPLTSYSVTHSRRVCARLAIPGYRLRIQVYCLRFKHKNL